MEKWEYKIVKVESKTKSSGFTTREVELPPELEETLDRLGSTGWELINVFLPTGELVNKHCFFCFFKRKVEE